MRRRAASRGRALVLVPVAGLPLKVGDLLIGVEAAQGLEPSVVVIRREGYASWTTIHRSRSLCCAYEEAQRGASSAMPFSPSELAQQLAQEMAGI